MVKTSKGITIPINRAEGDLEIRVEVENGIITDVWSAGTMFRGFEEMMRGRGALDGLVITPRICGICSLTHLYAAAEALDDIAHVTPPDNARRLRNITLMVETIQSDVRQAVLMFMVDFANYEAYHNHSMAEEAQSRYKMLTGRSQIEVIRETKRLLQMVAIIGGQWPHTSFMVPGGVTSIPDISKILQCRIIFERFRSWYEKSILGCSLERWKEVQSRNDLEVWLEEKQDHCESEVGFFIRFARLAGLDSLGIGPNRYLSYGGLTLPTDTKLTGTNGRFIASGFAVGTDIYPLDTDSIREDVSYSWYKQETLPSHPFAGRTKPYAAGQGGQQYSWIKAPRYGEDVVETGPLAEMVIDKNPLFADMIEKDGPNVFVRELARLVRPAHFMASMETMINELLNRRDESFYETVKGIPDGEGAGLIQAARGALGHWVRVKDEKITHYQIITPSAWNGSPRDQRGVKGAWEQALIGTPIENISNPVEAGHVIRSYDPCLVCAVHCLKNGKSKSSIRIGFNG